MKALIVILILLISVPVFAQDTTQVTPIDSVLFNVLGFNRAFIGTTFIGAYTGQVINLSNIGVNAGVSGTFLNFEVDLIPINVTFDPVNRAGFNYQINIRRYIQKGN